MNWKEIKEAAKKTWNFLWKDDSLLSWIVSIILAFIIVKFIFFPLLSLIFGSAMPLVVVESGSMHHPGSFLGNLLVLESNFDKWWVQSEIWYTNIGITKEQAINWPLKTGIEIGDIILVVRASNLKVGDIIIFNAGQSHPIIHRIIEIKEQDGKKVYSTKGDNNSGQLQIEKEIQESAIIGKAYLRLPKLGWIKLVFVKIIQYFS